MQFELIHADRLTLRKITPEVFQYIFENYSDKEERIFLGCETEEAFAKEKKSIQEVILPTVVLF